MQLQLAASPRKFLQVLLWLRVCAIAGQSITVAVVLGWLDVALPLLPMAAAIAALALVALATALRLHTALPAIQAEIFVQLLIDIAELTVVLYLSGGTTNPFASLYLIPVALAAVGLGWRYALLITLACLGCYSGLMGHFRGLAFMHATPAAAFDLHMIGMHVTFALSAALLAAALAGMAAAMRRRDRELSSLRENALRNEHLHAMGMLVAGAAHELSTPLQSMSLLLSELGAATRIDQGFRDDLALLGRQLQLCKQRLTTLLHTARQRGGPGRHAEPVRALVQQVLDSWSMVRPAARLQVDWSALAGEPLMSVDEGFSQALTSLLHNAADASAAAGSDVVCVAVTAGAHGVQVAIDDVGAGLDTRLLEQAGKAVVTTKREGFGLGLVLSHANLSRLDGNVTLTRRPGGGTRAIITLPALAAGALGG